MLELNLQPNKKAYFLSDFHLGAPNLTESHDRERLICKYLDIFAEDAQFIFLMGDVFDFWFEYRQVVPKGFTRLLGKLSELTDKGIKIYYFLGNHDMWMRNYLKQECGLEIITDKLVLEINKKKFFLSHGDGLGPGDYAYKNLKKIFRSPISQFLFRYLIPADLGMYLGKKWASHSWQKHRKSNDVYVFDSMEKEILFKYAQDLESVSHHDFYVFGHRHYKFDVEINSTSRYINLGDWIHFNSYLSFDGEKAELLESKL